MLDDDGVPSWFVERQSGCPDIYDDPPPPPLELHEVQLVLPPYPP